MVDLAADLAAKRYDVYFNVGLQDRELAYNEWRRKYPDKQGEPFTRGFGDTVVALPGFWIDIDIKGPNHDATNLPETIEEALVLLEAFPLPPTYVIFTGGGLHAYWLLNKPLLIDNDMERQRAKRINSNIQKVIRKEAGKSGLIVDNTADLARMLRLPGTINLKNEPIAVEVLRKNEKKYAISEFEAHLPMVNQQQRSSGGQEETAKPQINPIVEGCGFMRHTKEDAETLPETEWYAMIGIVAFCENGDSVVHELSRPYPNYSEEVTDRKIEQAVSNAGPRTCDNIDEMTGGRYCDDCPSRGKITSPIVLGNQKSGYSTAHALKVTESALKAVLSGNRGAHLEPEAINAFAALQTVDLPQFARLKGALKDAGAPIAEFNRALRLVSARNNGNAQKTNSVVGVTIGSVISDAPTPNIVIPPEYTMSNRGVYKIIFVDGEPQEVLIAHNPVIITGKSKDIDENNEVISLSWKRNGKWQSCYAERGVLADTRKIIQLADLGFPVHSLNSGDLVKFFAEMEALNETSIPEQFISSSLGWKKIQGNMGFLFSDRFITKGDAKVEFRGLASGDEQIAQGYHQNGEYAEWIEVISVIKDYPRVQAMFYASFSSVLLEVLQCSNYVIEAANKTSTGKTISLRVAASPWGCPDEKSTDSIIHSWDFTKVWIERASAIVNGLPLILDDTKRVKYPKQISEMVYSVANGRGRGRANVKSLARTKSWKTVLLSSAETPSVHVSTDGGARGRVLEICGLPFEKKSEEMRQLVTSLDLKLRENYGFAGPAFIEYILENQEKWDLWKQELHQLESYYAQKESTEVSGRLAGYAALITLTGKLVHEAIPLTWSFVSPMESLWAAIVNEAKDFTGELSALQYTVSWAFSNMERFEGREAKNADDTPRAPVSGWAGRWDANDDFAYIAFLPSVLKSVLEGAGYEYEAITRGWRDMQWLDLKDRSRSTRQLKFQGKTTWLIPIRAKAVALLNNDNAVAFEDAPREICRIDGSYFPES